MCCVLWPLTRTVLPLVCQVTLPVFVSVLLASFPMDAWAERSRRYVRLWPAWMTL